MRNQYAGKCTECGAHVPAGEGLLRNGKPRCASHVLMPGNVLVADSDDGYDQWKDKLAEEGVWGFGRNGKKYR